MIPFHTPFSTSWSASNLAGAPSTRGSDQSPTSLWLFTLVLLWHGPHLVCIVCSLPGQPILSIGTTLATSSSFLLSLSPDMSPADQLTLRVPSLHAVVSSLVQNPENSFTTHHGTPSDCHLLAAQRNQCLVGEYVRLHVVCQVLNTCICLHLHPPYQVDIEEADGQRWRETYPKSNIY